METYNVSFLDCFGTDKHLRCTQLVVEIKSKLLSFTKFVHSLFIIKTTQLRNYEVVGFSFPSFFIRWSKLARVWVKHEDFSMGRGARLMAFVWMEEQRWKNNGNGGIGVWIYIGVAYIYIANERSATTQIFHIQILPSHPPYNRTNNHPIPLLQHHWCWQLQKWHYNTIITWSSAPLSRHHYILASPLYTKPASNASDLADQFSSTLRFILDIHTPIKIKTVVQRPHTCTPWINPKILQVKRERSRLERCWRRWKSPYDRLKFRAQCNSVRSLISKAKSSFLSSLVTESSANPSTHQKTINTILHRNPSNSCPESPDASSLANTFLDFFKDKINRIRTKLYHLILWPVRFFSHLPRLQSCSILFQPLSPKFTNSFWPLKI